MKLLGFSGYARAGKDTAVLSLAPLGYQRVAFADPMREFLYRLNPAVGVEFPNQPLRLQKIIDEVGWDGYKAHPMGGEIRELMQRLGTECGRELMGENIWVNTALDNLNFDGYYAVADCRFPNEAQAIKERNGKVIRIIRPGVGPANSHASETSLDDWRFDAVIDNDGTVADLRTKLLEVL